MGKAESHRIGRAALLEVWPQVTGKEATLPELQLAGAQAHLEGGYGLAPYKNKQTGEASVLNNWGAIQAGAPPCGNNFEATDTHADGSPYQWCYKRYATPADGARHLVEHMTIKRPSSWEHMKRGDLDAWAAQMRSKDPISGTGLYFEQSVEGRIKGIEPRVAEIAEAMGEPVMVKRGGPVVTTPTELPTALAIPKSALAYGTITAGIVALVYWFVRLARR